MTGVLTTGGPGGGAGLITAEMLRATFDQWRIWGTRGQWFATRGGSVTGEGPGSLIHPLVSASTVGGLADQLAMQEWLRRMTAAELETVWRAGFAAVAPPCGEPS